MATLFQGPPAVDFYSQLSGLGDTIARNRADQAKRDAFAAATTPGPDGKIDYGRAILGLAQVDPQAAALFAQRQNHDDTLKQQAIDNARSASNDTFSHGIQSANLKIAQGNLANNSEGPEEVTAQRIAAAKTIGLQPGTPEHTQYITNGSIPDAANKPVPFETLSGTKFMVRQPSGGYTVVDPATIGNPSAQPGSPPQAPPAGPVAAAPASPQVVASAAPGAFSDRFSGAFPQANANAPSVAGPNAAAPSQPVDLSAVDPQSGRRENWLKSQSPDVQAYIKKIADYEIDPRTTSIKGGHREQVLSAVAQYDPTYNQNDFGSRAKAIRDFATGSQGNSVRSFDVAIDHLDLLKQYTKALGSGDVRVINSLRNKWLEETGSPLPTNLQAVAPIVGAEVSKAVIGSNNALADREELRAPLRSANSVPQINGAIEAYQGLMAGQLRGLKKQYEDTTGKKNFDSRVRENTRNILLGSGSSSASSSQPNVTSTGIKWSIQ